MPYNFYENWNKQKTIAGLDAVSYMRTSTPEQGDGTSLEDQAKVCKECCETLSLNLVEEFEEQASAMNARKKPRRKFLKMVEMLKAGKAKVLVVAFPDRLSRNGTDLDIIKELIDDYGITVILAVPYRILKAPVDPSDYLMLDIEIAFSNYRVRLDKQRCHAGIVAKNMSGERTTKPPYGYDYDKETKIVSVNAEKADFVRKAFELYATGKYSILEVADKLHDLGYLYNGNEWSVIPKQSLASILKNPYYVGRYYVKQTDEYVQGKHKSIISDELFEKVQNISSSGKKPTRNHSRIYSKLITCGYCGHMMTADVKEKPNGNTYVYYRCTNPQCRNEDGKQNCLRESDIDDEVMSYLREIRLGLIPSEIVSDTMKLELATMKQDLSVLRRNVARKREAFLKLEQRIAKNNITDEKYISDEKAEIEAKYGNLERKIYIAEQQLKTIETKVTECFEKSLSDVYSTYDNETKRKVLKTVANTFKGASKGLKMTFLSAFRKIRKR